jgi:hypothetical protein
MEMGLLASSETPCILWNIVVHYSSQKSVTVVLVHVPDESNPHPPFLYLKDLEKCLSK